MFKEYDHMQKDLFSTVPGHFTHFIHVKKWNVINRLHVEVLQSYKTMKSHFVWLV